MDSVQHGSSGNDPIAIVGSACRFSGSLDTPSKLWEVLKEPKELLTKIPRNRFNVDAFYHPSGLHHGTSNVTESYMLADDPRLFNPAFFNIKPIEAHCVDPQ
ncbi:putative polyketide synthase [Metarhizium anisopliae]